MSIDIKLTNQNLIGYARTDDAHEAFITSVGNGQARLALEVLVELINGMIEKIEELESLVAPASVEVSSEEPVIEVPTIELTNDQPITPEAVDVIRPKSKQTKAEVQQEKEPDITV